MLNDISPFKALKKQNKIASYYTILISFFPVLPWYGKLSKYKCFFLTFSLVNIRLIFDYGSCKWILMFYIIRPQYKLSPTISSFVSQKMFWFSWWNSLSSSNIVFDLHCSLECILRQHGAMLRQHDAILRQHDAILLQHQGNIDTIYCNATILLHDILLIVLSILTPIKKCKNRRGSWPFFCNQHFRPARCGGLPPSLPSC